MHVNKHPYTSIHLNGLQDRLEAEETRPQIKHGVLTTGVREHPTSVLTAIYQPQTHGYVGMPNPNGTLWVAHTRCVGIEVSVLVCDVSARAFGIVA